MSLLSYNSLTANSKKLKQNIGIMSDVVGRILAAVHKNSKHFLWKMVKKNNLDIGLITNILIILNLLYKILMFLLMWERDRWKMPVVQNESKEILSIKNLLTQ